jgi:hypothetical protein
MKNKNEQYPKKTVAIDSMSTYELCRWAALKEAVDIIADKCEERKLNFETFDLKPLDILKYVDSLTDDLYNKATTEQYEKI